MKIIIPVAGIGSRLKPHTHTVPKVLVKVAGKAIIEHLLDDILNINYKFSEIIFIVGHLGEKIEKFIISRYKKKVKLRFVVQAHRKGVAHAIHQTKEMINGEPILIILGDTIVQGDFNRLVRSRFNHIGVKEVSDPRQFGIVFLDKNKNIKKMIEKPEKASSNLGIAGIYLIHNSNDLFSKIEYMIKNKITTKNEYQITDALHLMIKDKTVIKPFPVRTWLDCGRPETLLETNQYLLPTNQKPLKQKTVTIHPPVYISKSTKLKNCILGPNVSIGENVRINNAIIQNSIIDDDAVINNLLLKDSIIGRDAIVKGEFRNLNIGDSSEVNLG